MSVIFDDLGIDYSTMMTDPQNFVDAVWKEALELQTVLKTDTSVDHYIKSEIATVEYNFSEADKLLANVYTYAEDNIPVGALAEFATKLRKLARDIEHMARDKAMLEIANDNPMDKSVAFDLYRELRKTFNTWLEMMVMLNLYKPEEDRKLPAMPGNFARRVGVIYYVFFFEGDTVAYRDYTSVTRRLTREGHSVPEMKNLMDLVDYIRANPQLPVRVSEQS